MKVGGMGGEIENTLEIYIHTMHNIHGERVAIATHGGGGVLVCTSVEVVHSSRCYFPTACNTHHEYEKNSRLAGNDDTVTSNGSCQVICCSMIMKPFFFLLSVGKEKDTLSKYTRNL